MGYHIDIALLLVQTFYLFIYNEKISAESENTNGCYYEDIPTFNYNNL